MSEHPPFPRARRRRKWMAPVVLAVAVAGALLLAELGLRAAGFSYPVKTQGDRWCGYAFVPHSRWTHDHEGHSQVVINSFGFRDDEWSISKPAGVTRIAVVGDSFVAGLEVEKTQRFTERLSSHLNKASVDQKKAKAKSVEVMNFGQPGFGTAQELLILRHKVWQFQPDLVLLAVFTGNDIRNNLRQLEGEPMLPYFELHNDELRLDDSFRQQQRGPAVRLVKSIAPSSRLLQLVYRSFHWLQRETPADDPRDSPLRADYGLHDPLSEAVIYQAPTDPSWQQAWRTTEALLAEFARECHDHDVPLKVVTLSNDVQVHPDPQLRARLEQLTTIDDWFYPDHRVAQTCRQLQVSVLTLAPTLQRYADKHHLHLHGFENTRLGVGHWNAVGHQAAAEHIAAWLSKPAEED